MLGEGELVRKAILLDYGNTLVHYFYSEEFPQYGQAGLAKVKRYLEEQGFSLPSEQVIAEKEEAENFEAPDHSVRALEDRLVRIFGMSEQDVSSELLDAACRKFLPPMFAVSRLYDDTHEALDLLGGKGVWTCIVSNTSWGSPADPWREEMVKHGVADRVDDIVFCRDVGWRKPDRRIYEHAMTKLNVAPEQCLFVGDSMRHDIQGAHAVGIEPVLIDRGRRHEWPEEDHIHSLWELVKGLDLAE